MPDIETETLAGSGGEAVAVEEKKTEATAEVAAEGRQEQPVAEAEKVEEKKPERKPNRTGEYIKSLQERWQDPAALEAQLKKLKASEPKLEDHQFDPEGFTKAAIRHDREVAAAEQQFDQVSRQVEQVQNQYIAASNAYAATVPDYWDAVNAIPFIPDEAAFAIKAHERGPEIAYHIATNDDALFEIANVRPELLGIAVDRIAKRLAAPQRTAQQPAQHKPITQAPPPPQSVSTRNVVDTPPEKLTDAEWYAREREAEALRKKRSR